MPYALKNRSLLTLDELSARDVELLLELARSLKRDQNEGLERQRLRGLHIAMLTEADAPPAGDPVEAAATEQGAMVVHIGPRDAHRSAAAGDGQELARLLGRLYDAIEVRGMVQPRLREFARHCSVPVYRNFSHATHPARIVADLMTMQELAAKPLARIALAWLGDPRGEQGTALVQGALLMGLDLRIAAPRDCWPWGARLERLQRMAQAHGARLSWHESAPPALAGSDFRYGDPGSPPPRPAGGEPVLQAVKVVEGVDTLQRRRRENRVHTIKAMLVATLT